METYYINGYRIAARSYNQALESARQLTRGEYPFDWPGETARNPVKPVTPWQFVGQVEFHG